MERCGCSKVLVMMQLITQRCSVSSFDSVLYRKHNVENNQHNSTCLTTLQKLKRKFLVLHVLFSFICSCQKINKYYKHKKVKKHQHTLMLVACRLRMRVIVHLIGQYILTTIKSTKKHQSVSATMNALSVQLSLHASTIVLKMTPEDP